MRPLLKYAIVMASVLAGASAHAADLKSYQGYLECVEKVIGLAGDNQAAKLYAIKVAPAACGASTEQTIIVKDGVATITTKVGDKTTIVTRQVGADGAVNVGGTTVTFAPPFKPSPTAQNLLGPDFDWKALGNENAKQLSDCLANSQCDVKAYLEGMRLTNYSPRALELSKCVKARPQECDLEAYKKAYAVNGYHKNALDTAKCVSSNKCDLEAYLSTYALDPYHKDAFDMAQCVAAQNCDIEAFQRVYQQDDYYKNAREVSACVKSGKCDLLAYLKEYSVSHYRATALKIAKLPATGSGQSTLNAAAVGKD
jgi:hypothetical protein